jgi:hypothetical protein
VRIVNLSPPPPPQPQPERFPASSSDSDKGSDAGAEERNDQEIAEVAPAELAGAGAAVR